MNTEAAFRVFRWCHGYPRTVLILCLLALVWSGYHARQFHFDASSETLVVEGDADLARYERITAVFGGDDFLFMTFQPVSGEPITTPALETLASMVEDLRAVAGVAAVFSILDAPLLKSPPVPLTELADGMRTLRSPDIDLDQARQELNASPFFKELLVTEGGQASAIRIDLARQPELAAITGQRQTLKADGHDSGPEWNALDAEYRQAREAYLTRRAQVIADIRAVQTRYADRGTIHLGGVPMIAADMIAYVENDLWTFGGLIVLLMIATLILFFRRTRWVVLPIATAALAVVYTVGLLGYFGWQATVVSSNFISLLGITTISLTIHLIVRYRELLQLEPDSDARALVVDTMSSKFAPCFFTALTTIAAFGSLTASRILPVEDFGWMMCIGIAVSFLATFTFFPAMLLLLPRGEPSSTLGKPNHSIRALGELARWRPGLVALIGLATAVAAVFGIRQVSLDNRFAEYFQPDTEIYQGMRYIDRELGGTIPFDVVLGYPSWQPPELDPEDDFFFDEAASEDAFPERYWFTRDKLDRLEAMHRHLESAPQVGKVLSLTALEDLARQFNDGRKLSSAEIAGVLGALPDGLHDELIDPYASPETGELRLTGRIIESGPAFDRAHFREQIQRFATQELGFQEDQVIVSGMMVLFNSMLLQLLDSQISTLGYVLGAVFIMFLVLLRSLPYALLGLIPNCLAAAAVIAGMGYAGIPLDMMTITIAAISIGIGVDDTIHYLHRFREEFARWQDAQIAVSFCHASIGRALYFTSLTVMAGFSVLYFSNFVPTVMFGIWTAVAMLLALLANLVLLPALLVLTHGKRRPTPVLRGDAQDV